MTTLHFVDVRRRWFHVRNFTSACVFQAKKIVSIVRLVWFDSTGLADFGCLVGHLRATGVSSKGPRWCAAPRGSIPWDLSPLSDLSPLPLFL